MFLVSCRSYHHAVAAFAAIACVRDMTSGMAVDPTDPPYLLRAPKLCPSMLKRSMLMLAIDAMAASKLSARAASKAGQKTVISSNATCRPSSARAPAATRPWAGPSSARIRCVPWVPCEVTAIVSFAVLSADNFRHNFMPLFLPGEDLCVLMTTGDFHVALTHLPNLSFSSPILTSKSIIQWMKGSVTSRCKGCVSGPVNANTTAKPAASAEKSANSELKPVAAAADPSPSSSDAGKSSKAPSKAASNNADVEKKTPPSSSNTTGGDDKKKSKSKSTSNKNVSEVSDEKAALATITSAVSKDEVAALSESSSSLAASANQKPGEASTEDSSKKIKVKSSDIQGNKKKGKSGRQVLWWYRPWSSFLDPAGTQSLSEDDWPAGCRYGGGRQRRPQDEGTAREGCSEVQPQGTERVKVLDGCFLTFLQELASSIRRCFHAGIFSLGWCTGCCSGTYRCSH